MNLPLKAFLKAVALGTLAGGGPPMIFTLPLAIGDFLEPISGDRHILADVYLAVLPLLVALALVFASSISIGLPFHFLLQRWGAATREKYVLAGAVAGFVIPLIVLISIKAEAGHWMAVLGAFSGAATGFSWARSLGLGSNQRYSDY